MNPATVILRDHDGSLRDPHGGPFHGLAEALPVDVVSYIGEGDLTLCKTVSDVRIALLAHVRALRTAGRRRQAALIDVDSVIASAMQPPPPRIVVEPGARASHGWAVDQGFGVY